MVVWSCTGFRLLMDVVEECSPRVIYLSRVLESQHKDSKGLRNDAEGHLKLVEQYLWSIIRLVQLLWGIWAFAFRLPKWSIQITKSLRESQGKEHTWLSCITRQLLSRLAHFFLTATSTGKSFGKCKNIFLYAWILLFYHHQTGAN